MASSAILSVSASAEGRSTESVRPVSDEPRTAPLNAATQRGGGVRTQPRTVAD